MESPQAYRQTDEQRGYEGSSIQRSREHSHDALNTYQSPAHSTLPLPAGTPVAGSSYSPAASPGAPASATSASPGGGASSPGGVGAGAGGINSNGTGGVSNQVNEYSSSSTAAAPPKLPPRLGEGGRQYSNDSFGASTTASHAQSQQQQQQQPSQPRPSYDHRQSSSAQSATSPTLHTLNSFGSLTISGGYGQGGSAGYGAGSSSYGGSMGMGKDGEAVPVGFDEGILRGLCEMDCALPLLADRIKQSIASCKQVAVFFRSRAEIEEKYARSLVELSRTTGDVYGRADCKAGSFVMAYQASLKMQDQLAGNRIRFSQRLNEMSDELLALAREGEKLRKQHKENGARYQGQLQESEVAMDKAKARFDSTAEELERLLVAKEGESFKESGMRSSPSSSSSNHPGHPGGAGTTGSGGGGSSGQGKKAFNKAIKSGGMLFKGKGPASIAKQEDDTRSRMAQASETFRKAVLESQGLRQEYFNFQLPKILRLLKECADELDMGTQYHLTRYAFLYETTIVSEGQIVNPMGSEDVFGLKHLFETIDNRNDFKTYMQNYAVARGAPKGPRRDGPYEEGFLPPLPPHVSRDVPSHNSSTLNISAPFASSGPVPSNLTLANGAATPNSQAGPSAASSGGAGAGAGANHHLAPGAAQAAPAPQGSYSASPSGGGGGGGTGGGGGAGGSGSGSGPNEQYAIPGIPASSGATFGVDLGEQLNRDGGEVPRVVELCSRAIEAYGLENTGIYRLSGTTSRVQALKKALDTDIDHTDVMSDEWSADINVVSGALKLWFRELPEPLLTYGLYHQFIEAARYENDRLRHIRLHEQVNELPDPNYATLKFFMGHLDRIRRKESVNQMSISNLSIVFGPTLLGAPPEEGGLNLEHMSFQCKAIETILEKYSEIFVEEDESAEA